MALSPKIGVRTAQTRSKVQIGARTAQSMDKIQIGARTSGIELSDNELDTITGGVTVKNNKNTIETKLPNEVNEDDPACALYKFCWYKGFFRKCKNCYYCDKSGDKYYCTNASRLASSNNNNNNTLFI